MLSRTVAILCLVTLFCAQEVFAQSYGSPPVQEKMLLVVPKGTAGATLGRLVRTDGANPTQPTTASVSWDDAGLTVTFDCIDDNVTAKERPRDDADMWLDDCVDIFIDPGHTHEDKSKWVHLLINASGGLFDERGPTTMYHPATGASLAGDIGWNAASLKADVQRTSGGWSAKVFIAWDDLGGKPKPGDVWGFNVGREDNGGGENTCWSPTFGPFSKIHRWGHLLFFDDAKNTPALTRAAEKAMQETHDKAIQAAGTPLQRYLRFQGVGGDAEPIPKELRPAEPAPRDQVKLFVRPVSAGKQMVRLSLPVPRGLLRDGHSLSVSDGQKNIVAATRVLTWYPVAQGQKPLARRVMVTFPYEFATANPVALTFTATDESPSSSDWPVTVTTDAQGVTIAYANGPTVTAKLVAPARHSSTPAEDVEVESNAMFRWRNLRLPDDAWPRVIETRVDATGTVTVVAHLQNWDTNAIGNERFFLTTPYLGWDVTMPGSPCQFIVAGAALPSDKQRHEFKTGQPCDFTFENGKYRIYHPTAVHKRRGYVEVAPGAAGGSTQYRYLRATPWENVPMQAAGWRKAEFVVAPASLPLLTATLEYPGDMDMDWRLWDELYQSGKPLDLAAMPGELASFAEFHHNAVIRTMCVGDDWGDITLFANDRMTGMVGGQSRLNHCPPIFEEGWRSGDRRLVNTAVLWCENFHDTSVYWGPGVQYGGSRYPSYRNTLPPGVTDQYQWRADSGGWGFTTKGSASFFMAYEQTGDPRMLHALDAQITHVGNVIVPSVKTSTRMMGILIDFIRLYRWTGRREYLDTAINSFRSFAGAALQPDHLFTEGGGPPTSNDLFVPHDTPRHAYKFYKPNNMAYSLESLPDLMLHFPDEPRLRECVNALADFMAAAQDPLGGWRYPHPRSPQMLLSHSLQHAHDMATSGRVLGARDAYLDAAERFLRVWFHFWKKTGRLPQSLGAWEYAVAKKQGLPPPDLQAMYEKVTDRDTSRDYTDGDIDTSYVAPEGLVYFANTLRFYLQHRPASRILAEPPADSPLGKVLSRVEPTK